MARKNTKTPQLIKEHFNKYAHELEYYRYETIEAFSKDVEKILPLGWQWFCMDVTGDGVVRLRGELERMETEADVLIRLKEVKETKIRKQAEREAERKLYEQLKKKFENA